MVIEKQLNVLFCFSAQENVQYLQRIYTFPEEGLDIFMQFIDEAKQQQDAFIAQTIQQNPEFAKAFSRFVDQTTLSIMGQFEIKEQQGAESIISKLS